MLAVEILPGLGVLIAPGIQLLHGLVVSLLGVHATLVEFCAAIHHAALVLIALLVEVLALFLTTTLLLRLKLDTLILDITTLTVDPVFVLLLV